jgi:pimeloyl-ACP methyl ester carboxylesterase
MPPGTPSIELFARAVETIRSQAGAKRMVLAGHSMGGPVIRKYALMYPDRVAGLVLVDGLVQIPESSKDSPSEMGRCLLPPMRGVEGLRERLAMIHEMFGPLTTLELRNRIERMMMATSESVAEGAMKATHDRSAWSSVPIGLPTLAVYAGIRPLASEQAV